MRKAKECLAVQSLLERRLLDESLSEEEEQRVADHLPGCDGCRLEADVWMGLHYRRETAPGQPSDPKAEEDLADAVVRLADSHGPVPASSERGPVRFRLAWAWGAVAALPVLVLSGIVLFHLRPCGHQKYQMDHGSGSVSVLTLVSGQVRTSSGGGTVGDRVGNGAFIEVDRGVAAIRLAGGALVVIGPNSRLKVKTGSGSSSRLLLEKGQLLASVPPLNGRQSFSVETRFGWVEVVGTVFAVDLSGGREHVGVLRGKIKARLGKAPPIEVSTGQELRFSSGRIRALKKRRILEMERMKGRIGKLGRQGDARLAASSNPSGAMVFLDGTELGRTPISAMVRPGRGSLEMRLPGYEPVRKAARFRPGSTVSFVWSLERKPDGQPADTRGRIGPDAWHRRKAVRADGAKHTGDARRVVAARAKKPAIPQLLALVRAHRAKSNWRGVAAAYKKLVRLYPRSPEARTCLVPLGQVQLRLGSAGGALVSFNKYLKAGSGGAMAQEALHGQIKALARLGRRDQERKALQRFLGRYPNSVYAPSARARLNRLSQRKP